MVTALRGIFSTKILTKIFWGGGVGRRYFPSFLGLGVLSDKRLLPTLPPPIPPQAKALPI